jgi:glc operon protein GlcG
MRPRATTLATLVLALALPAVLSGQLAETKSLTSAAVKAAMAAAEAEAVRNGWAVSIAVVDTHGELLGFHRMDGASLPSIEISQAKARTSARGRQPSKVYADRLAAGNTATLALDYMPLQGGVPITVDGVVVGAIGASGVTSAQDEQVAMAGAAAVRP